MNDRVPHEVAIAGFNKAQEQAVKALPLYDQCVAIYRAMRAEENALTQEQPEAKLRHMGKIAHVDHGKTSLTAAITKVLSTPTQSADQPEGDAETLLYALERMTALYESEFDVGEYRRPEWLKTALSKRYTQPSKPTPASGEQMEVVAWLHPTAKWATHSKRLIEMHCRKDGSDGGPQPLVTLSDHLAAMEAKDRIIERWRANSTETWQAMNAMRDAINEHIPMPSLESDLLQGPENSIFCATVAEAVVARVAALREALEPFSRRAPVQGFSAGISWDMHLRAYDAYCKKYRQQEALITGGCRGGFGTDELDMFIPGWREEVAEDFRRARTTLAALTPDNDGGRENG
jgi:hypothetical protein